MIDRPAGKRRKGCVVQHREQLQEDRSHNNCEQPVDTDKKNLSGKQYLTIIDSECRVTFISSITDCRDAFRRAHPSIEPFHTLNEKGDVVIILTGQHVSCTMIQAKASILFFAQCWKS